MIANSAFRLERIPASRLSRAYGLCLSPASPFEPRLVHVLAFRWKLSCRISAALPALLALLALVMITATARGQVSQRIPKPGAAPAVTYCGSLSVRLTVPAGASGIEITPLIKGQPTTKYVLTVYKPVSSGQYIATIYFTAPGAESFTFQWL